MKGILKGLLDLTVSSNFFFLILRAYKKIKL